MFYHQTLSVVRCCVFNFNTPHSLCSDSHCTCDVWLTVSGTNTHALSVVSHTLIGSNKVKVEKMCVVHDCRDRCAEGEDFSLWRISFSTLVRIPLVGQMIWRLLYWLQCFWNIFSDSRMKEVWYTTPIVIWNFQTSKNSIWRNIILKLTSYVNSDFWGWENLELRNPNVAHFSCTLWPRWTFHL